jgi:hypothetical protein
MIARSSFKSRKLGSVTDSEHLLFYGLILESDDEGRGEGDPYTLRLEFGNREWGEKEIATMMQHLAEVGLVFWYTNNGGQYYEVVDWMKYQEGSWHGRSAKVSDLPSSASPESEHQYGCMGTPCVVTPNTNPAPKLSKEKGSKEKENVDFIDDFEDWWVRYPNKQGKTNALRYYSHWRKTKTAIEMHQARENYLQNKARYSSEVYSNGSTFLNPSPPSGCTSANIADYFPPPPAVMKARLEKALATLQKQKADLIAGRTPKEMDGSEIDRANEITLKIREVKAELEAICDQE